MKSVKMFKMPFDTKHFNTNQKVWIATLSGNQSAKVVGKFRGKGRYVTAWVSWRGKVLPEIKELEVNCTFASRLGLGTGIGDTDGSCN